MKTSKQLLGVFLAVLFILSTPCISFANNTKTNYKSGYEEYHDQINFEDLMMHLLFM